MDRAYVHGAPSTQASKQGPSACPSYTQTHRMGTLVKWCCIVHAQLAALANIVICDDSVCFVSRFPAENESRTKQPPARTCVRSPEPWVNVCTTSQRQQHVGNCLIGIPN
jgi:hypothetical protein